MVVRGRVTKKGYLPLSHVHVPCKWLLVGVNRPLDKEEKVFWIWRREWTSLFFSVLSPFSFWFVYYPLLLLVLYVYVSASGHNFGWTEPTYIRTSIRPSASLTLDGIRVKVQLSLFYVENWSEEERLDQVIWAGSRLLILVAVWVQLRGEKVPLLGWMWDESESLSPIVAVVWWWQ